MIAQAQNKILTDTQAHILRDLRSRGINNDILPEEVYPERNNQDNAARRTLHKLVDKGVLEHTTSGFLRITDATWAAYERWYVARGWRQLEIGR